MFAHYSTSLLDADTVIAVKGDNPAADLALLREGNLHHSVDPHAFLPSSEVDSLIARLSSSGPTRAAGLAAGCGSDRRGLVRTLLWLKKFDVVEFRAAKQRQRDRIDSMRGRSPDPG